MRNQSREIDRTFLSLDLAEERGLIHRDYLAHCLRWSHVVKFLNQKHRYKEAIVLDVGCGKEMPLAKTLYVNKMTPRQYIGVDANKFSVPDMLVGKKIPIRIWAESDFCALEKADVGVPVRPGFPADALAEDSLIPIDLPNVLTCFEVLEHVTPEHARRMLIHFGELTSPDVDMFISTPNWDGSAAGNHINEMTAGALGSLIEDLGYEVRGVFGTFASIASYESELNAVTITDKDTGKILQVTDMRHVFAALRNYYDTNVLSVIFAPLFPMQSRNCLWHIGKKSGDAAAQQRLFAALSVSPGPWSQHPNWRDMVGVEV